MGKGGHKMGNQSPKDAAVEFLTPAATGKVREDI
jgi:hypothetical protein